MRWMDPLDEMRKMQSMIDSAFSNMLSAPALPYREPAGSGESWREPLCNMWEDDNAVNLSMEIPGVPREDIRLSVRENELELKAESRKEKKDVKKGSSVFERTYAGFYRLIPLPADVDAQKTTARYNHGVLEVRMPKTSEGKKKGIEVKIQ